MSENVISVVIPTHNRSDALELTLEHLSKQDFSENWEAIVVNNNSTDDTDRVVEAWQPKFPVRLGLVHESKPGPAAARNAGAKASKGMYLVFMDNDILTDTDFVSRHYLRLEENPGCWIVGQYPNLPEQQATVFGRYKRHLYPELDRDAGLRDITLMTGQGSSLPRADFEALGGFDESFFVASGEDTELALRAMKRGIRILQDPAIIALHNDWAGTSIRDYCKRQRIYTQTEPLFAQKYADRNPRLELALRNSPVKLRKDGIKLTLLKLGKNLAGSRVGQSILISTCELLEHLVPDSRVLWRLYRISIAGAIHRGYQEGIQILSSRPEEL